MGGKFMENEALSITDKRTDAKYELALSKGAVRAADLRQIKTSPEDFGVMSYDPAFLNT
ncbi:MAG: citrate (Si)-synthase, partial [Verrucomicrobia bacterium]